MLPSQYRFLGVEPFVKQYRMSRGTKELLCFPAILAPDIRADPSVRTSWEHDGGHSWESANRYVSEPNRYSDVVKAGMERAVAFIQNACSHQMSSAAPELRDQLTPAAASATCVICAISEAVFGISHDRSVHLCLCAECESEAARRLHRCPICRRPVESVVRVHGGRDGVPRGCEGLGCDGDVCDSRAPDR